MRTPGEFAAALFGHELQEGRLIATWSLRDKKSRWWRSAQALDALAGHPDTFIAVSLAAKDYGPTRRLPASDAIGIGGVWLDLDVVGGPEDRGHGAPSKDEALRVGSAVLEPTLVVDSGWGIHTWHLLPEPWRFRSRDEQRRAADLAARWYALHAQIAAHRGWHLDQSTRDLARIMRLPGTVNAKGDERRPVTVRHAYGPRYGLDVLEAQCAHITPPDYTGMRPSLNSNTADVMIMHGASPPADKLLALLYNSPEFAATWHRLRHEFFNDQSRYDLSLASIAAQAAWTNNDIAALIGAHRGWDRKATRRDYIERTIAKARTEIEDTRA